MTTTNNVAAEQGWGHWRLPMYLAGLFLPIVLFEHSIWFPDSSIDVLPAWIAISLLFLGPLVSFLAVALSHWSIPMTIVWSLLIPLLSVALLIAHWVLGSTLLDRPFLPLD
jgi:hypothetical protein